MWMGKGFGPIHAGHPSSSSSSDGFLGALSCLGLFPELGDALGEWAKGSLPIQAGHPFSSSLSDGFLGALS
eukprot:CAMPEP_0174307358 /NCGR_PEP_ID=MMETSP0810-20121108/1065_1 /TAXON_ID=73025 ORGANISM="Eutreptiella gymnastica-like, Strain CCMP1594" /NCGR_SAMPLE_ID=MMETSP0810 /ASSEMBLY_ACC=CAM_ASM_000659 /LENGTH=70 /DNA_ID=CAMNT_0015414381 /DNA_START=795 /DNA_END=1004 /DNA_ORIENTATION=-